MFIGLVVLFSIVDLVKIEFCLYWGDGCASEFVYAFCLFDGGASFVLSLSFPLSLQEHATLFLLVVAVIGCHCV